MILGVYNMAQSKPMSLRSRGRLRFVYFLKDVLAQRLKKDDRTRRILMMHFGLFLGFVILQKLLLGVNISLAYLTFYLGIFLGLAIRTIFKDELGREAAAMIGISIAMAALMVSIFFRILF